MDVVSYRGRVSSGIVIALVAIAPLLIEMPGMSLTARHAGAWLGWLGAGMLSSSLLLMVREPCVVRWVGGMDRMYRWHHALGIWACVVLLAHPTVLAVSALSVSIDRALGLLSPGRWFPANAFGWAALLGLVAGLLMTVFWKLPYRTWRRLHIGLTAAVLLAIAHAFAYSGLSASLLLIATPSLLAVAWRLLRIDRGIGAHPYEVESVSKIKPGTSRIVLKPLAAVLRLTPGQCVMVAFHDGPGYDGCREFHPYTVCDSHPDGSFALEIKAVGDCTARIQSLRGGVVARIQGPYDRTENAVVLTPH